MKDQGILIKQIDFDKVQWEELELAPGVEPGECEFFLSKSEHNGASARLGKFPAGFIDTTREWHSAAQEIFLLQGDLTHDGTEMHAPAYMYIPPRGVHGPFSSKNGAIYFYKFDGEIDTHYV